MKSEDYHCQRVMAHKAMKRKGHRVGGPFSFTTENRGQSSDGTGSTTHTDLSHSADYSSSI